DRTCSTLPPLDLLLAGLRVLAGLGGRGAALGLRRHAPRRLAQCFQPLREGRLQEPDIARIADEVEALPVQFDAALDARHQPAESLAVPARGGDDALDR